MTDAAIVSAGLQSLKAAFDIGKALLKLGISVEVKDRIREMNDAILSAQESAIASQQHQSALLKQIDSLETRVAEFEKWDAEAETYQLADIAPHVRPPFIQKRLFAYVPKEGTHSAEPPHSLCAKCFNDRHKSILQTQELNGRVEALFCQNCHEVLYVTGDRPDPEIRKPRR